MMFKSPLRRVGGKYNLSGKIVALFPEHERYIEPFGGAMHVLFRKEPAKMEVYNDINGNLVNFFDVVKNNHSELLKQLDFTLYSREVFLNALKNLNSGDDIQRAVNFYLVNQQCFGGKMGTWGVSSSSIKSFSSYEERIREAHERLKGVHIENLDWRKIIQKYDCEGALFYVDPPYMFNKYRSKSRAYTNELTDADHAELAEALKHIKGKFVLSGYENHLYSEFDKAPIGESYMNVKLTKEKKRVKKKEFIWKNF